METKFFVATFMAIAVASLLLLTLKSWRAKRTGQENLLSRPTVALDFYGEEIARFDCQYVATTMHENHLERVVAYGLGHRGRGIAIIYAGGVQLLRTGELPLAIPRNQLIAVGQGDFAIDRAVEKGGLTQIAWILPAKETSQSLTTHLRLSSDNAQNDFLASIQQARKVLSK